MNSKKKLVILSGPTAAGKTALSIALAKEINGEIISADSMQVYKGMDVGTAKILPEEMQGIKHHLIDIINPDEPWSVSEFKAWTLKAMEEIYSKGKIPIIVGGTGFYIQSVLYDINFEKEEDDNKEVRAELIRFWEDNGTVALHDMLRSIDPQAAEDIHMNNVKRVMRAIEFYRQTGKKISEHNQEERQKISPYNFVYFVLTNNRDILYKNIDKRVDIMLENGLVDEVRKLELLGYDRSYVSMQGLGYKEILDYLKGEIDLETAVEILKRDTRHFAKRQLTWFKREKDVIYFNKSHYSNEKAILDSMLDIMKEKEIYE